MIKKTIGGDRLGSGNRMKAELHNYERSTHNLGNVFRSTMAPGVLVPFYKKLALNGDTWSIDLTTLVRTMPAIGPLFGSYKLQLDIFQCPIRLYNGILHNNMTKIGMDMAKVKLPILPLDAIALNASLTNIRNYDTHQHSSSSLAAYLGIRGVASIKDTDFNTQMVTRSFNAVPFLAYYDIFKNYYANKQEEKAYVIRGKGSIDNQSKLGEIYRQNESSTYKIYSMESGTLLKNQSFTDITGQSYSQYAYWKLNWEFGNAIFQNKVSEYFRTEGRWVIRIPRGAYSRMNENWFVNLAIYESTDNGANWTKTTNKIIDFNNTSYVKVNYKGDYIELELTSAINTFIPSETGKIKGILFEGIYYKNLIYYSSETVIQSFDLKNIDDMRIAILQNTSLNTQYDITMDVGYPYQALWDTSPDGLQNNIGKMNGLVLKTYQSDIFNNWLSTEWIDGLNGISAITAVSTASGSFTMDALNLAHKVYNMLNRIAISGGTYEDWQEAVYGEDAIRRAESPIYCGGMSGTIAFEEVVSTADTNTDTAGDQPLGSLAGKGTLVNADGGHVEIHVNEPSYIIGIASITPIIDYCQGNDFDMTEIESLDDLHKPALDQIGYQNVMVERAAWWATTQDPNDGSIAKSGGGKIPAWLEYMTSINQVYGDFADGELSFMTLTRNYEVGDALYNGTNQYTHVKDWTTYINPTKYNYQFANTKIDAQNFWVQIGINAIARRKMSAKVIPNL